MTTAVALSVADTTAITRARERWLAALHAEDTEGLTAPLTTDSVVFPPHEPPLKGHAATRAWHQARIDQFATRLTISPEELIGAGEWAIDRFAYTIALTPRTGGPAIEDEGNCLWVWHRDGAGQWRVARGIWNSSRPLE